MQHRPPTHFDIGWREWRNVHSVSGRSMPAPQEAVKHLQSAALHQQLLLAGAGSSHGQVWASRC
jgi:hypothetical protein